MDKKKGPGFLHYLTQRMVVYQAGIFVLALATTLVALNVFPNRFRGPVLDGVLLMLWAVVFLIGYLWLYRPYRQGMEQLHRFLEGYISIQELKNARMPLPPEVGALLERTSQIVESTRTLDLSKRQAQYRALQNQINPHFLYNTLEGIRSEALMEGLDNLADMTESLAIFFRYTISKVENLVTLEEELENCQTYFRIQQYRFGSRIHLKILRDEDWEENLRCLLPKLTLQPILENSIIHGIELKLGEGTVTVEISRSLSRLIIRVKDDGIGMDQAALLRLNGKLDSKEEELREMIQPEKGGVALTNVNNRIHLIFGEQYGLHVYSMEGTGTTVELTIPVVMNEKEL